jgi:Predicted membrane protein (DUF2157)
MSERKLKSWVQAGLIDSAAAERIRVWEASHAKPLALWAIIGIAALAIGLGIISLIAANWDAIDGPIRLGIHFVIMIGLAVWLTLLEKTHDAFHEAGLFILGALGLAFFGHIGQVYQTSSPLWQPLGMWLLLFSPLLLGFGRGWLSALAWFATLAATAISFVGETLDTAEAVSPTLMGITIAAPILVVGLAAWMRNQTARPDFWLRLQQVSLVYAIIVASLSLISSADSQGLFWDTENGNGFGPALAESIIGIVAAALVLLFRKDTSGKAVAGLLIAAAALNLSGWVFAGNSMMAAILFIALWAAVASASLYAGWRHVFQASVAVIALRLIILSFELADDLLGSGVGLILTGVLTLGIAWIAFRISRKFAPVQESSA